MQPATYAITEIFPAYFNQPAWCYQKTTMATVLDLLYQMFMKSKERKVT